MSPEYKQTRPTGSSGIETRGLGAGKGCRWEWPQVRSGHKGLQQREDRVHKKGAAQREEPLGSVHVSHLEGLNRCWKEAPEVGEWLLGPPFQQQGDLGMGQGSEPFL